MKGYRLLIVSDGYKRDGMVMELAAEEDGEQIAEVFEDDETKQRTVTFFVSTPVPLEAIEWLLDEARKKL